MPSSAAVLERLTPIIVQVVGCEPDAVVPSARLKQDLGVDSLSIVEIVEQLGLTFDLYIPDDAVNGMVTVKDTVNAVVNHDPAITGPVHPAVSVAAARSNPHTTTTRRLSDDEVQRRKQTAWKFAWAFVGVGLVLGLVFGLGGAALVDASGLKGVTVPDGPTPSATATATPTPTPSPTPTETSSSAEPEPSIVAASTSIAPGEKLRLTGAFPALGKGASLQVQVKDKGSAWDDFPVTTKTKDDSGKFVTVIFTTRTGERQFRLLNKSTDKATPAVTVTIGR